MKKQKVNKPAVHIVQKELLQPYNPVTINLIGAGGTGGQLLTALARMNHALTALGHAGIFVRVFDNDIVDTANLGRQLFTTAELGQYKAVALINRINRFFGTNWKAETVRYDKASLKDKDLASAIITISCVDTVAARYEIAEILQHLINQYGGRNRVKYWLDFGNSRSSGQVILSTLEKIKQPASEQYRPVEVLPLVTEEYKDLLEASEDADETPSCSLAEALSKQDLFINSALANCGASLLWQMFREGILFNRGFFLNLADFRTQPLKVA
ncbi:PRTRC system ThiF family protein [Mucilaginibacter sp. P19]|uniref:PRTRC system ThiF family protein n=1 Tax=Mucilaginibacter sp. P19 TaxID=3423947 RepID=UPI003D66D06C